MSVATVTAVEATSTTVVRHHGLSSPSAGDTLDLLAPLGTGAFGTVHPVAAAGSAAPSVVAKVFDPTELARTGGAGTVVTSLQALWDRLDGLGDPQWPDAVLAIPFAFVTVRLAGEERLVALMLDLAELGYVASPFDDPDDQRAYAHEPVDVRTQVATRLAERAALLAAAGFVHGDLNPANVMWCPQTRDVQVIDFDSGVVVRTGAERPRTPGKLDDCMPPDVKVPSAPGGCDATLLTAEAERWSWGSLIGMFLFAVHPAFFLDEISPTSVAAYARAPESWPAIDERGPLFTTLPQNRRAYAGNAGRRFRTVPGEVVALFARFFDAGLDGDARPTADEWLAGLTGTQAPPTLEVKLLTDPIVLEGDDVSFAWHAENATHVEATPGGRHAATGSVSFVATAHVRIAVTAFNAFGSETVEVPTVRVVPLPRIDRIVIPTLPRVSPAAPSLAASALARAQASLLFPAVPRFTAPPHPGPLAPPVSSVLPRLAAAWTRRPRKKRS